MDHVDPVPPSPQVSNDHIADIPEIRDDFYYFQNLVFKVEDTLFCVPRNAFERPNGNFFSDALFSIPGPGENGEQIEGRGDKHPLILSGVSKEHFRGFLRVMYPLTTKYEDWVGVLHLSTMWGFVEIRERSIQAVSVFLDDKPVIDKILLARKYHVKDWLFAGYTALVLQDQLDFNELLSALDPLTVARLFYVRETFLRSQLSKLPFSENTIRRKWGAAATGAGFQIDKSMDLPYGSDLLDSTHAFADSPVPGGSQTDEEDPQPSVHPNFNFELVVFQVGETLFKVIKNGFQVPGTIFEAMFSLPPGGEAPVEGTSLETPIVLEGVGVLHLATMWEFAEIRAKAIAALSVLNPERELTEKISLGARYGIVDWLRDGYTELVQRSTLKMEDLRGSSFPVSWETTAKIFCARDSLSPNNFSNYSCCGSGHGPSYTNPPKHCRCRVVKAVDEAFSADFEALNDNPISSGPPLPTNHEAEPSSKKKKGKRK
ncbi:hypothetical protein M413DRAFT_31388 [Hebeloma cylindrosporum]|uniref:BTB domain-containing protein n=1 Tax=Hebeloma cylindrosporum TaxID=76867 RepID=A0A0C2XFR6_HEBCY|nr:hypothetical protein M413DRAFT_31388 [Hebeloma cylindrosporum h7]